MFSGIQSFSIFHTSTQEGVGPKIWGGAVRTGILEKFLRWLEQNFYRISHKDVSWAISLMNWCNMPNQVALARKTVVTNVTFDCLFNFMNWFNMSIHVTPLRKAVITNVTFEWLFTLMNSCNMLFQGTLLRTAVVTNVTFEFKESTLLYLVLWADYLVSSSK